ncbi:MAG: TonB-dependent receptor [Acidobacteriota bacterium]
MPRGPVLLLLLLLGSTLLASPLAAQSDDALIVVVLDPAGLPLPGARVVVVETGHEAAADSRGRARVAGVPPGTWTLVTSAEHLEPVVTYGVVLQPDRAATVTVAFRAIRSRETQIDVIGEQDAYIQRIPGSVGLVGASEIASSFTFDANELLRRVPGVHVRQDSGPAGARLNIGIRGLDPDRSRQVLMLEDGLPVALAPYGEPEMYYSPPIERIERIEVVKGSGSILFGPQTIGGVINLITPDPPVRPRGQVDLTLGSNALRIVQASGGTTRGEIGLFAGALLKQGDGFRSVGFGVMDGTLKTAWTPSPGRSVSLKLNAYDERSNSTYLGLTTPLFETTPGANPVPDDRLDVNRLFGSLHGRVAIGERTLWAVSGLAYGTKRFWRRQDFDRTAVPGRPYVSIAGRTSVPGGAIYLRGTSGSRDREFLVTAVETRVMHDWTTGGTGHELEAGGRLLHETADDRFVSWDAVVGGSPSLRDDERRPGTGVSAFVQDRLRFSSVTVTPGLRLERYAYARHILRKRVGGIPAAVDIRSSDRVAKLLPGIGLAWQVGPLATVFAGAHRGFAPPRVKDALTSEGESLELDAELSWNYEAGARWTPAAGTHAEVTGFMLDFSNQIVPAAQSGGATTTLVNGGETSHAGVEAAVGFNLAELRRTATGPFAELRLTWLPLARFASGAYAGNRLPYAPKHTAQVLVGWHAPGGCALRADAAVTGSQFADNIETAVASADGTIGIVLRHVVWNVAADCRVKRGRVDVRPFVAVKNAAGLVYVASRAPDGIQPGPFRQVNVGARFSF